MVAVKDAVESAIAFATSSLGAARTINIRLEEIESSFVDGNPVWLITLSNLAIEDGPLAALRATVAVLGADAWREYKVFTVSKATGEVLSMKIRLLATPNSM